MTWKGTWQFMTTIPRGLTAWVRTAICALTNEQGRAGWAMLAALGCCVIMSGEVIAGMWLTRKVSWMSFWFGMSAQAVNLIVVTGLMVLLGVRRSTKLQVPIPGGGTASLGIDDSGAPVVITSTPVQPPAPAVQAGDGGN